ncbi:hypothetical protein Bca52824_072502 [Brassica carinata]|uniref:Uncharacterized protein n=1 Tax=Brassica carinata TaxID=52824 RepID=A0A8X7Q9B7_BRACI|nr:hypothetical protein Bca52824_072502 [Brassica carinata]
MFSGEWRSDLPTVLPIRAKRLDIFPRDIQKQVTEANRLGTLPDLSAIIAAQLGLTSGEGPSMAVPRADEVFPSDARSAGKGKKRKRGDGSGVERSTEETSDTPPSGEPRKKKKKRRTTKKSAGEQLENADKPIEQEEEDAREEELQPEEGASEAEASEGRNDEEGVSEGEERETSLNAVRSSDSEEDSEGSPLLIRRGNDEDDDERWSPVLTSPRERTPVPEGVPGRGARVDGDNVPVLVLSDTSVEGRDSPPPEESRRDGEENTSEVSEDAAVQVSPIR